MWPKAEILVPTKYWRGIQGSDLAQRASSCYGQGQLENIMRMCLFIQWKAMEAFWKITNNDAVIWKSVSPQASPLKCDPWYNSMNRWSCKNGQPWGLHVTHMWLVPHKSIWRLRFSPSISFTIWGQSVHPRRWKDMPKRHHLWGTEWNFTKCWSVITFISSIQKQISIL